MKLKKLKLTEYEQKSMDQVLVFMAELVEAQADVSRVILRPGSSHKDLEAALLSMDRCLSPLESAVCSGYNAAMVAQWPRKS